MWKDKKIEIVVAWILNKSQRKYNIFPVPDTHTHQQIAERMFSFEAIMKIFVYFFTLLRYANFFCSIRKFIARIAMIFESNISIPMYVW